MIYDSAVDKSNKDAAFKEEQFLRGWTAKTIATALMPPMENVGCSREEHHVTAGYYQRYGAGSMPEEDEVRFNTPSQHAANARRKAQTAR